MVIKTMTAGQAVQLVRKRARTKGYTVDELPGRGKGSHRIFELRDKSTGTIVGRFSITAHDSKYVSWAVLKEVEAALAELFEDKTWMEKK